MEVFVVLKDILDFESESNRLQKELAKLEKEFGLTHRKLSNDDFLQKAPHEVIDKEREKNARLGEKIEKLNRRLEIMNGLRESRARMTVTMEMDELFRLALLEDIGSGDATTLSIIPPDLQGKRRCLWTRTLRFVRLETIPKNFRTSRP